MARIRSLRANVTREEATEHFSSGHVRLPARIDVRSTALRGGFLHSFPALPDRDPQQWQTRLAHIWSGRGQRIARPLHLRTTAGEREVFYLETRNCTGPLLGEEEAIKLVTGKVQRLLFSTGFFRVRDLHINAEPVAGEIYIPYWVGFRGRGPRARLTVIDAVRRKPEGAKVRQLLRTWLTSIRTT